MLEKRKHKRLKMEHALELARLNADGTAATRVTVTTGLVTKDSTEIVSGLKAGDRVVTKGQSYLSDGAAVHVVTSDATDGGEG